MPVHQERPWIVGITGASGAVYGVKLCRALLKSARDIHLVITEAGWRVLQDELDWRGGDRAALLQAHLGAGNGRITYHNVKDIGASIASGSHRTAGMVVVPCSMGTLSAIAKGASDNLLERAADVMLKEGRPLLLVPRETPLHAVHLENMLTLARIGAKLVPAMPAFYHKPSTLDEATDFLVGKVLDLMDIEHDLYRRWGEHSHERSSDTDRQD
ncbi:MAG: UbiX family flavin prenyltransferase [Paenibacillaceae bacterium]|jgi:4-hydroxy-3-polyprenylbenzoate decarboxylase|nr:UbiX family flavin prenyltransferase [Paenibacillaceae bacterium]